MTVLYVCYYFCISLCFLYFDTRRPPAEVWLPSLQNARRVCAFCSYSESYGVLFQAIIGRVALP